MKTRSEILAEALAHARHGLTVAIVTEDRRQGDECMGMLRPEIADAKHIMVNSNGAGRIAFPSGGSIRLYSQRHADRWMRGASFDRIYVDVMPMILATSGCSGQVEVYA